MSRLRIAALALVCLPLAACPPTCQQLCQKLDRCGFDPTRTVAECREACDVELTAMKDSDADSELEKAYYQQRVCLGDATCDEIAAGTCYDESLFAF